MTVPVPQSSGTTNFGLSNATVLIEAFDRLGFEPTRITRHQLISGRRSLNLELQLWSNRGLNLWKMVQGTINLVAGQAVYDIRPILIDMTEMYYTTVDTTGGPNSIDRIMVPITRTQYDQLSNKGQQGLPTQYWFQRYISPQVTIWEVPYAGAPDYVCNWWGLQQIFDAGIAGAETPDVPYRGFDALAAGVCARLAEKFAPARLTEKRALAKESFLEFAENDQEAGAFVLSPNVAGYRRM